MKLRRDFSVHYVIYKSATCCRVLTGSLQHSYARKDLLYIGCGFPSSP